VKSRTRLTELKKKALHRVSQYKAGKASPFGTSFVCFDMGYEFHFLGTSPNNRTDTP
jgi:hypothetical protein